MGFRLLATNAAPREPTREILNGGSNLPDDTPGPDDLGRVAD